MNNNNGIQLKSVTNINHGYEAEILPPVSLNSEKCILSGESGKSDHVNELACRKPFSGDQIVNMNALNGGVGYASEKVPDSGRIAIRVRDAVKYYEPGVPILNNLNMTVREGTIYTLLGSSGCGKTTLLSCIVGFQKVDAGDILVFGCEPCSEGCGVPGKLVGYMPQEISLYPSLSIQEVLEYFGILYGIDDHEIKSQSQFLVKFLDLPDKTRRVGTLSGGQMRRLSFAVSLLPDPPLLILDEPTVGVDPLLRESIWDHLVDLVSRKKTTVIITTHYIEESKNSHTIGLMRNGRLLIEKSPQILLEENATSLLAPIVLKLCKENVPADSTNLGSVSVSALRRLSSHFPFRKSSLNKPQKINPDLYAIQSIDSNSSKTRHTKNHLWAMMKKNTLLLTRNYLFLLFLICVPAIQACLFCLALGNDPKPLPFGIVNHEVNYSEPCIPFPDEDGCVTENLSCKFIDKIPTDKITLHVYETGEEAMRHLRMGSIWGYMEFPEGYSEHFYTRATSSGQFSDNETFEGSNILFEMDASSKQITATLIKVFADSFKEMARGLLRGCGYDERGADPPMKYLTPVYGDYEAGFKEYLAPSLVLGILFFFPILSSSMQCIREKKQGTLERTIVAGVRTWEILSAYSVTESAIVLLQTGLGFFIISLVFQIPIKGSIALVVAICMLIGLSGVSVGFLIGNFCREETEAALLSMAVFFPNFILAGMFWPLEGLPVVLQYIAYCLPCTLASESIRSIVNRSWGFFHPKVWPGFAVTIAWITLYWILNIIIHSRASIRRGR